MKMTMKSGQRLANSIETEGRQDTEQRNILIDCQKLTERLIVGNIYLAKATMWLGAWILTPLPPLRPILVSTVSRYHLRELNSPFVETRLEIFDEVDKDIALLKTDRMNWKCLI